MHKLIGMKLEDEYNCDQIFPSEKAPEAQAVETPSEVEDQMSEETQLALRVATFETIIADAIDDIIEDNDGVVDEDTISKEIDPVVDQAIALRKLPASFKKRIPKLILECEKSRVKNPMVTFLTKLSSRLTDEVVSMNEENVVIPVDATDAETIQVREAIVEPTPAAIEVDEGIPAKTADEMRYLTASAVNNRKATVMMCRNLASPMAKLVFNEFKYCLPERAKKKFNLN